MPAWVAPVAIAGVQALINYLSAKNSSNAAQSAASTQSAASDYAAKLGYLASQDALKFQQQQWADTMGAQTPWIQAGQGALSKLSHLLGVTPGSWSPSSSTTLSSVSSPNLLTSDTTGRQVDPSTETGRMAVARPAGQTPGTATATRVSIPPAVETGRVAVPRTRTGTSGTASTSTDSSSTTGEELVLMQAPDGTLKQVPTSQVAHYQSLGAVVVGG